MAELRWECWSIHRQSLCPNRRAVLLPTTARILKPKTLPPSTNWPHTLSTWPHYTICSSHLASLHHLQSGQSCHSSAPFALPKMLQALLMGLLLQEDFLTIPRPQGRMNNSLLHAPIDSVGASITETCPPWFYIHLSLWLPGFQEIPSLPYPFLFAQDLVQC